MEILQIREVAVEQDLLHHQIKEVRVHLQQGLELLLHKIHFQHTVLQLLVQNLVQNLEQME